ncbi:hypothetical protein QNI19_09515 [Cytophagaceae bacterium DM2B3-1]|uniref:Uncharacterized protein n=2 Tax=Xanthocytophaga flava TaxID=3048013 RepID=A0ABT7CHL9_9BACT|nr:hypothetical protein [Xanthocytophaga flavus]MDJ1470768.1 hypothetical protein [Xanthocytophaga flavus]MDJ1493167.1 hypothetical protein [Xanthocytophaga flavus]
MPELSAQTDQKFVVELGQIPIRVIPFTEQYTFRDFRQGTISFHNGQIVGALLNYNRLFGEIQFIHLKGDTLSFAQEKLIQQIKIDDELFYFDQENGYVHVVTLYPSTQLAEKQLIELEESKGSNGRFSGYFGPTIYGNRGHRLETSEGGIIESNKLFRRKTNQTLTFHKKIYYYFIDHNNRIHKASAYAVRKIFSRYRKELNQYLIDNPINFKDPHDLHKLLTFCTHLSDPK